MAESQEKAQEIATTNNIEEQETECIEKLKSLIAGDSELSQLLPNEELYYLLTRARRCRPENSFKLLKSLINYKNNLYPELFENVGPETIKQVLDAEMIQVVKRTKVEEPAVLIFRVDRWDTNEATFDQMIKAGFCYGIFITRRSVEIQRNGIIVIFDMSGFSFSHARQSTYSNVTKLVNCIIFGAPFRINCGFIINCPYIFDKCWQVVKFAIPEFYRNFITVTQTDLTKLHKLVNPESFPESLGGCVPEEDGWETDIEAQIWRSTDTRDFLMQISVKQDVVDLDE